MTVAELSLDADLVSIEVRVVYIALEGIAMIATTPITYSVKRDIL
jgi:hypothetical protein